MLCGEELRLVFRAEEAEAEVTLTANRERPRRPRVAESDSQHPTSTSKFVATPTTAEAQGTDEASAVINEQSQRGPETVPLVGILEGRISVATVRDGRRLRKGRIIAGGFDDRKELARRNRFGCRMLGNCLDDTGEFLGGEIEDDLVDRRNLVLALDHALNLQALDDLARQRPNSP